MVRSKETVTGPAGAVRPAPLCYDVVRGRLDAWLRRRPDGRLGAYRHLLLLLPDIFAFVLRLATDRRVGLVTRLKLWGLLAYMASPVDVNLDAVLPFGPLDDLALALVVLDSVWRETPDHILLELWPGDPIVLDRLRGLTAALRRLRGPRPRAVTGYRRASLAEGSRRTTGRRRGIGARSRGRQADRASPLPRG